jgi:hypothetical protein
MQRTTRLLRRCAVGAVFGLATLALPLSAPAGVRVAIGIGVPVYPAPVVVYPAPVIVAPPVVYGSAPVWVNGPSGHRHRHWRHHHHHKHRW